MFAIFTRALGDQSLNLSTKNGKVNSNGYHDSVTARNPVSKKRRKKPKKKKAHASKGAGGNNDDDDDEDDDDEDDDGLLTPETTVTKRINIADLDQSNGLDPVEVTIDEIVSRNQYPRDKVAACVRSMWDRGLRYDDPEAVIKQLNTPTIMTIAPAIDVLLNCAHDADKFNANAPPEPQFSIHGAVNDVLVSSAHESTHTILSNTNTAEIGASRPSTEAEDLARLVIAAGQPHARAAIDGFYWWFRGPVDLASGEDPHRAGRVELLLSGDTLETLLENALSQLRQVHAKAMHATDEAVELCTSIQKLLTGLLVMLYSTASTLLVATLTRHMEALLGEFILLPAGANSAAQMLAQRLGTVIRRAASSHSTGSAAAPVASLEVLAANVDALNSAVRDALAGAKEGNADLPELFYRRDLLSSRLQLQLDITDRLSGSSLSPSIFFNPTPASENEELLQRLSPPPELTPVQLAAQALARDRRARLSELQTESEKCDQVIKEAQARLAEIAKRVTALQQEVASSGPELTPARNPHAIALVGQLTQLETVLAHGLAASSSAAEHGHSQGSEAEAGSVAEFMSSWAGTQAQCVAVLATRAASAKKRVETLASECQLYQSLALKAIVVSTQAEIARLEKEKSEDITAIGHLETEAVTVLSRVRLSGIAAECRTVVATALHSIADSLRSAGLQRTTGLSNLLLAYSVVSATAPLCNGNTTTHVSAANDSKPSQSEVMAAAVTPPTATDPLSPSSLAPKARSTKALAFSFADSAYPTSSPANSCGDRPYSLPVVSLAQMPQTATTSSAIPAAVISVVHESAAVPRSASTPAHTSKSVLTPATKTAVSGPIAKNAAVNKTTVVPTAGTKNITTAPTAAKNSKIAATPGPVAEKTNRITTATPTRSWGKASAPAVVTGKSFIEIQLAQEQRVREATAAKKKAEAALLAVSDAEKAADTAALASGSELYGGTSSISCNMPEAQPEFELAFPPQKPVSTPSVHNESSTDGSLSSQNRTSVVVPAVEVANPLHENGVKGEDGTKFDANVDEIEDDCNEDEKEVGIYEDAKRDDTDENDTEDGAREDVKEDGPDTNIKGDNVDKEDDADENVKGDEDINEEDVDENVQDYKVNVHFKEVDGLANEKKNNTHEDDNKGEVDEDVKGDEPDKYVKGDEVEMEDDADENEQDDSVNVDFKEGDGNENEKEAGIYGDVKGRDTDEDVNEDCAGEDVRENEPDKNVKGDEADKKDDADEDVKGDEDIKGEDVDENEEDDSVNVYFKEDDGNQNMKEFDTYEDVKGDDTDENVNEDCAGEDVRENEPDKNVKGDEREKEDDADGNVKGDEDIKEEVVDEYEEDDSVNIYFNEVGVDENKKAVDDAKGGEDVKRGKDSRRDNAEWNEKVDDDKEENNFYDRNEDCDDERDVEIDGDEAAEIAKEREGTDIPANYVVHEKDVKADY